MPISPSRVEEHIRRWAEELERPTGWSYRAKWPRFLFHHAPVENAASIIRQGALLARSGLAEDTFTDVAPEDLIARRAAAHRFARLYFRPGTPTQFHIEGIRRPAEFYHGRAAPILVLLAFKLKAILTLPGVRFSNGNMQSPGTADDETEGFFDSIPFELVYHDMAFQSGSQEGADIVRARCAEVLVPSPLPLADSLAFIMCRSEAERRTLTHMAGNVPEDLRTRIRTYTEVGLFENRYTFVREADLGPTGLKFTLNPRRDGADVITEIKVRNASDETIVLRTPRQTLSPSKIWNVKASISDGRYLVEIHLEDQLAYRAFSRVSGLPF